MSTIDHPSHYGGDTPYEAIKVIEAWGLGFHLGNAVKYINRAGRKGEALEDLQKARWYIDREIARITPASPAETGPEAAEKVIREGSRVKVVDRVKKSTFIGHRAGKEGLILGKEADMWDVLLDGETATVKFFRDELEVIQ